MGRDETHDAACKWAFRKTFRRRPTPDESRDYKLALDGRDRLGDALPIFSRLRSEAGPAPVKAVRTKRRRADAAAEPPPRESRGRPPKVQQAPALLREQLGDGPKPGALVEAAAKKAEIPKRDLLAATHALGVRTQRGQWWLPG